MFHCSCVLSSGDEGEVAQHYAMSKPVARKEHVCSECRRTIRLGEIYERVVAVWDDRLEVINTCEDCRSIMKEMFCEGVCHGVMWDDLRMHLEEDGTISEDCLLALTPRARGMVCDLIQEDWEEQEREGLWDEEAA